MSQCPMGSQRVWLNPNETILPRTFTQLFFFQLGCAFRGHGGLFFFRSPKGPGAIFLSAGWGSRVQSPSGPDVEATSKEASEYRFQDQLLRRAAGSSLSFCSEQGLSKKADRGQGTGGLERSAPFESTWDDTPLPEKHPNQMGGRASFWALGLGFHFTQKPF